MYNKQHILKGRGIRQRLLAVSKKKNILCVGTSMQQKVRLLYEVWMLFSASRRDYRIDMINIDAASDQMGEAELIESLFDYSPWQKDWEFLKICDVPIGCAVPKGHPLAPRRLIRYGDLRAYTIVLMNRNLSELHQKLYEDILSHGGSVVEVSQYDAPVLWECACSQYLLQAPLCWQDILSDMKVIPCEWEFTLPYGFFYRKGCSAPVREFIDFTYELYHGENDEPLIPVFSDLT